MNTAPQRPFVLHNPDRNYYYTLTHRLGGGAFGDVWAGFMHRAVHESTGAQIAVKILKPTSFEKDFSAWHSEQAMHLRCLNHPNIVQTYDQFFSPAVGFVLVMERGRYSLDGLLRSVGKFPLLNVCFTGIQVCTALEHIHALNVIHRDVTLKNIIWFDGGTVKLSDFGISKQLFEEQQVESRTGVFNLVPPELAVLGYSTTQSDIYQLGLVLLTVMTGANPVPDTCRETARKMIAEGVPRARAEELISAVGSLAEVISVMLRRRAEFRYQNVSEVREHLQAVANVLPRTPPLGS